jgi:uncharacterized protein (DUF433 family)
MYNEHVNTLSSVATTYENILTMKPKILPQTKGLDDQIAALSTADKVALHTKIVQALVGELHEEWPGIEKTPGIVGGDACIVRTRIPVWSLELFRRLGWSDDKIIANFPTLQIWDLHNAWVYISGNQDEIELAIQENEDA